MADQSFLDWPFLDDGHRAWARELADWVEHGLPALPVPDEHDLDAVYAACGTLVRAMGSAGLLQCGNQTPSEVVQWDANGVKADKPEAFFLQRYAAAYARANHASAASAHSGTCTRTGTRSGTSAARELRQCGLRELH